MADKYEAARRVTLSRAAITVLVTIDALLNRRERRGTFQCDGRLFRIEVIDDFNPWIKIQEILETPKEESKE